MTSLNLGLLAGFAEKCSALGVTAPKPIERALELLEVAYAHATTPERNLLAMSDDEAREHIEALSIRQHVTTRGSLPGLQGGIQGFREALAVEVRTASLPELDALVTELQPRFDELAAPLVTAAQTYGFTSATTSDQVIELADEAASEAWRAARRAWGAIAPIVALRIEVSKVFTVAPSTEQFTVRGVDPVNYSVAFAASDNWSADRGYYIEGRTVGHLDWLALALGGLRLNTPSETLVKIAERTPAVVADAPEGAEARQVEIPAMTYPTKRKR